MLDPRTLESSVFCLGLSVLKYCMFLWESMQCRSNFTGFQHVKDGLVYRITSDCPYWNLLMLLYIQGIITLEPQTSVYIGIPCTVMLTNFEIIFWTFVLEFYLECTWACTEFGLSMNSLYCILRIIRSFNLIYLLQLTITMSAYIHEYGLHKTKHQT